MDAQIRVPLDPALYPVQLLPGALCNAAHRYIFARAPESARAVPLYMRKVNKNVGVVYVSGYIDMLK
jgi:hypothetical protein